MATKQIKTGVLFRTHEVEERAIDADERTLSLSFSSEAPVERHFGTEILDHRSESVRLNRLRQSGPLLVDHDRRDHIGVVENVSVDTESRTGRATVRFGKGERASEIFQDVLDGIRRNVSVGYVIHDMEESEKGEFRAVDWEPLEVSLVSVPADITVGVGRSDEYAEHNTNVLEYRHMDDQDKRDEESQAQPQPAPAPAPSVDVNAEREKAARLERERISSISDMGAKHNMDELAREYIREGKTAAEFNSALLDKLPQTEIREDSAEIGLTDKERKEFSFMRAIQAEAAMKGIPEFGKRHIDAAGFELECHEAAVRNYPGDPKGIIVPDDVLRGTSEQRDLQVAVGNQGGNLVAEEFLGASFIELLRNNMVSSQLGVRSLDGLVGDIAIPKHTAAATAYWVSEGGAPTESTQTIGQIAMTPKTLGAFTDYTRKLLLQSSIDIENFVRQDFAQIVALEMDRVVFYGLGASGEPKGIQSWADVNTTSFSTSATPTWAEIVDMEGDVATDNALMGSLSYVTHPTVRANMKTTSKAGTEAIFVMDPDGRLNGYNCLVSTQITATHVWFGNWADAMVGRWGGVDILVDPYTASTTGTVRVVIFQSCDVAVRHGQSFSLGS